MRKKKTPTMSPKNKGKRSRSRAPVAPRKSDRVRGVVARYQPEEIDFLEEKLVKRRRRDSPVRKPRAARESPALTEEERRALEVANAWLEDFHDFLLRTPHGRNHKVCSETNARGEAPSLIFHPHRTGG